MRRLTIGVLVFLGCMFLSGASVAWADGIDFGGGTGGSFSFKSGLGHTFQITNVPIACVSNETAGTCLPDSGKYELLSDSHMSFKTGGETSSTTGPFPDTWDFAAGGSLTITGGVPSLGITNDNTVLLSGTFTNGFLTADSSSIGTFTGTLTGLSGNTKLLNALGAGTTNGSGESVLTLQLHFTGKGGSSLAGRVTSSTTTATTVPEPASLALMGMGLLGIAFGVRRQASQTGSKG